MTKPAPAPVPALGRCPVGPAAVARSLAGDRSLAVLIGMLRWCGRAGGLCVVESSGGPGRRSLLDLMSSTGAGRALLSVGSTRLAAAGAARADRTALSVRPETAGPTDRGRGRPETLIVVGVASAYAVAASRALPGCTLPRARLSVERAPACGHAVVARTRRAGLLGRWTTPARRGRESLEPARCRWPCAWSGRAGHPPGCAEPFPLTAALASSVSLRECAATLVCSQARSRRTPALLQAPLVGDRPEGTATSAAGVGGRLARAVRSPLHCGPPSDACRGPGDSMPLPSRRPTSSPTPTALPDPPSRRAGRAHPPFYDCTASSGRRTHPLPSGGAADRLPELAVPPTTISPAAAGLAEVLPWCVDRRRDRRPCSCLATAGGLFGGRAASAAHVDQACWSVTCGRARPPGDLGPLLAARR